MGTLMKLYREWLVSGDDAYLRSLWPQAKKTLAYAWQLWDPDRDGVMEGEQHNTYDIEFYGPNTMCGALYLGALRACRGDGASPRRPRRRRVRAPLRVRPGAIRPRAVERRVLRAARADARAPRGDEGEVSAAAPAGHPGGGDHAALPVRPGLPRRPAARPVVRPRGRARPPPARRPRPDGRAVHLPVQLPAVAGRPRELPARVRRQRGGGRPPVHVAAGRPARGIPSPTPTSAGRAASTPSPVS